MDFFIKKNATLPVLKLQVVKDGRSDYNKFMDMIEESSIFFSMVDVETGIPKISSRPAGFVEKTFVDLNAGPEYYIYYQFTPRDTNRIGRYAGQFMLRNSDGVLILPIREELFINVQDSFIADDLVYDSCYVSEFPCCINGPYTTTTTTQCCPCTTTTTTINHTTTTTTMGCSTPVVTKFPDNQFTNQHFITIGATTYLQITATNTPTSYSQFVAFTPGNTLPGTTLNSNTGLFTINYTGSENTFFVNYMATNNCGVGNNQSFFNFVNYDVSTLQAPIDPIADDINHAGFGKNFLYLTTCLAYMGGTITHYEVWINGVLFNDYYGPNLGNRLGMSGDRITGLPSAGDYEVKSRLKDSLGNYSPFSEIIIVTVP